MNPRQGRREKTEEKRKSTHIEQERKKQERKGRTTHSNLLT